MKIKNLTLKIGVCYLIACIFLYLELLWRRPILNLQVAASSFWITVLAPAEQPHQAR